MCNHALNSYKADATALQSKTFFALGAHVFKMAANKASSKRGRKEIGSNAHSGKSQVNTAWIYLK